jgi:hypothetical protein
LQRFELPLRWTGVSDGSSHTQCVKLDELNPVQKRDLKTILLKHKKALQAEMKAVDKKLKALEAICQKNVWMRKVKR